MPNITGTPNDDILIGTSGDDRIDGFAGRDILIGGGGADEMFGGADDDVYSVDNVGDRIREVSNQGNDIVYSSISYKLELLISAPSVETLSTDQHNATTPINLEGIVTTIYGNYGNNVLREGRNLHGFLGDDTYVWDITSSGNVFEAAGEGNDLVLTRGDFTLGAGQSVESITALPGSPNVVRLTGNALTQTITGNAGANTLDSGTGAPDVLIGLGGNDIYHVRNQGDQVVEAAGGGTDTIVASFSFDLRSVANVENLSAEAGTAAINLFGDTQNNILTGNAGNNTLDGNGGADTLRGGTGDDIYIVRSNSDRVIEVGDEGNDIVYTSVSYALDDGILPAQSVETLSSRVHSDITAIDLLGNARDNTLIGNYGNNVLNGGAGADIMIGLNGNDTYIVDLVADPVIGGGDRVFEAQGGGSDIVYALVSHALTAGQEVEILSALQHSGTDAIDLTGNEFAQAIYGNFGANSLDGKGGSDTLLGFSGADIFAFTTALGAGNVDTIGDFSAADDTIALDDAVFAALGAPGALDPNAFVIGGAAQDANDRIIYNSANGQLLYDADGSGAGAAIHFATLQGAPAITAADFMVI